MNTETPKSIRFSAHARGYLVRRGFTEEEVEDAIRASVWQPARGGRLEAARDFSYDALWNGTFYTMEKVRPIFVEEQSEIVVVTVYTYFF